MKCPKCGKDVELQKIQVGLDDNGEPILNEFAICRDCRKKWNLDKQRQKKAMEAKTANATKKTIDSSKTAYPTINKDSVKITEASKTETPAKIAETSKPETSAKIADASKSGNSKKSENISKANGSPKAASISKANQSSKVASASKTEDASKSASTSKAGRSPKAAGASKTNSSSKINDSSKNVDSSTKTANNSKPERTKRPNSTRKRSPHSGNENLEHSTSHPTEKKKSQYGNIPPENVRKKRESAVKRNYEDMLTSDSGNQHQQPRKKKRPSSTGSSERHVTNHPQPAKQAPKPSIPEEPPVPTYEIPRLIIGILTILCAVFFGFKAVMAKLDGITSGGKITTSTTYLILALCLLITGLITLIMKSKRSFTAFIIPILLCAGSGIFTFLKRGDDKWLLIGAILSIILVITFVAFAILLRDGDDDYYDDDNDDYDDPFDDDYDEY